MDAGELLWIPLRVECPDGLTDQIRGVTYVQSEIVALCFKPIYLIPCHPRLSATDLDGDMGQERSRVGSRQWRRFAPLPRVCSRRRTRAACAVNAYTRRRPLSATRQVIPFQEVAMHPGQVAPSIGER